MQAQLEEWELTANHYVAIPMISRQNGAIHSISVLHRQANGVIEWVGSADRMAPLLAPVIAVDQEQTDLRGLTWDRLDRWIPRFRCTIGEQLTLTGTLCAPVGYEATRRGFVYSFEIENHGGSTRQVSIGLDGSWAPPQRVVCSARSLPGIAEIVTVPAREGVALEVNGSAAAAVGIAVFAGECSVDIGARRFLLQRRVQVAPARRAVVTFYCGVAQEREGALATAAALRRLGAEQLIRETRLELSRMARRRGDAAQNALLNRNLLFSFFFAAGRAIDDDRLYAVTSRSPLHPRCGTFNERDALLWALPAIVLCDAGLAREYIMRCFEQYSHRPGEAVRYLDGTVLEPGLALNQWCAYVLALDHYVRTTADQTLLEEPLIRDVLREFDLGLYARLHPEVFLGATELQPSGDPATEPYLTYDNALLHALCRVLQKYALPDTEEARRLSAAVDELGAAIWRRLTVDVHGEPLLAWSTDLAESASVYDDPAGSLQLLPHYGFCQRSEPLWNDTVSFLRSAAYRLWLGDRKVPGLAARATPQQASTAGLCADLLGAGTADALGRLRSVVFPGSVAATHYDVDTGRGTGGIHDAGVAGFLAWSLYEALNE